jgi:peptidoglycan/xylan/chitin deacetylase (PgdA/CDA1 family)
VSRPLRHDWPLILAYHSVSESRRDALAVRLEDFEAQIAWLRRRGYRSTTLADFVAGSAREPERLVIVTFDDGYADNQRLAAPVLQRHGFSGTFFVVSDYVGSDRFFPWDLRKLETAPDREAYRVLDWDQVRALADAGFEIGSHSCTHPRALSAIPAEECWDELARSRRDLEQRLARPVVSFCYPRGDLDADVMQQVEKAGYHCAVVTPTRWGLPLSPFTLRRIGVYQENPLWLFRLKTTRLLRRNYERLHWLRGRRA